MWCEVQDSMTAVQQIPGFENVDIEDPQIGPDRAFGGSSVSMVAHQPYHGPAPLEGADSHIVIRVHQQYWRMATASGDIAIHDFQGTLAGRATRDRLAARLGVDGEAFERAMRTLHQPMFAGLRPCERWTAAAESDEPGAVERLRDQWVTEADEQVRRSRERAVEGLVRAREQLDEWEPDRRELSRHHLYGSVGFSSKPLAGAAVGYERAAVITHALRADDPERVDIAEIDELAARARQARSVSEILGNVDKQGAPWLAGTARAASERGHGALTGLRARPEWSVMERASVEAAASCLPPDPDRWQATTSQIDTYVTEFKTAAREWESQRRENPSIVHSLAQTMPAAAPTTARPSAVVVPHGVTGQDAESDHGLER